MRTLYHAALMSAALLPLIAPTTRAAEPDRDTERDRKARVALAMAGKAAVAVAPAPRAVTTKDYAAGYKAAAAEQKPLVVFVGCKEPHPAPGAVVARTEQLADVTGPAAVVGYPVGTELYVHATLSCPVDDTRLKAEIDAAAKKIERPPAKAQKAAPKPLDWEISATPPACPNCETCPHCGKSLTLPPAKVPAAPAAPVVVKLKAEWHVSPDGTVNELHADGTYRPVPGIAKQKPSEVPAPTYSAPSYTLPSCSNGRCPTPR